MNKPVVWFELKNWIVSSPDFLQETQCKIRMKFLLNIELLYSLKNRRDLFSITNIRPCWKIVESFRGFFLLKVPSLKGRTSLMQTINRKKEMCLLGNVSFKFTSNFSCTKHQTRLMVPSNIRYVFRLLKLCLKQVHS